MMLRFFGWASISRTALNMKWMLLWACMSAHPALADLSLDEMSCDRVFCAAVNGDKALMNVVTMPASKYFLFRLGTKTFAALEDGRFPKVTHQIFAWGDGFMLVWRPSGPEGSLTFTGKDGSFKSSLRFSTLEGLQDESPTNFTLDGQNRILVSYQDEKNPNVSCLGELLIGTRVFRPNLARVKVKPSDVSLLWVADTRNLYLISPYSGRVYLAGKGYLPFKTIKQDRPLVNSEGRTLLGKILPGPPSYKKQVNRVESHGSFISFIEMTFTDEKEKKIFMGQEVEVDLNIPQTFLLAGSALKSFPYVFIANWAHQALSFDEDEATFQLNPAPTFSKNPALKP